MKYGRKIVSKDGNDVADTHKIYVNILESRKR